MPGASSLPKRSDNTEADTEGHRLHTVLPTGEPDDTEAHRVRPDLKPASESEDTEGHIYIDVDPEAPRTTR